MICLNICILGLYYSSKNKTSNKELLILTEWNSTICIFYHWKLLTDFFILDLWGLFYSPNPLAKFWRIYIHKMELLFLSMYSIGLSNIYKFDRYFLSTKLCCRSCIILDIGIKRIRIHNRYPNIAYNLVQKITYGS